MNHKRIFHIMHQNKWFCLKSLLIFSWCIGVFLGTYFVSQMPLNLFSLMRSSFKGERFSIVGFLLVLNLPLVLSVISVALNKSFLMLPVLFIKAFLLSVCWFALYIAFGSAGWLVTFFMLLTEFIASILTLLFLFNYCEERRASFITDYFVMQIFIIIVGFMDYTVISPIWVDIISI